MKVLLHSDMQKSISQSGVGRAQQHQMMALQTADITYTTDPRDHYDLIHINTIFPQSYLMAKHAERKKKPIIYHAHSTEEDFKDSYILSNQVSKLFKQWLRRCYGTADLVLTPSTYSKSLLDTYDLNKPVRVISNGIDLDYWQATPEEIAAMRKRYNLSSEQKVVISVGLQIKRKGIIEFVECAKRLPHVTFIWFGHTSTYAVPADVQKAMNTELDNLIFAGYIPREELRIAYQMADIYVFMTHEETEGIVLLEALASQVDTIIRDLPVFNYLKADTHVYKAEGTGEFTEKIDKLLKGTLPSLAYKGLEIAEERSIEAVGEQYKEEYQLALRLHHEKTIG